ncbi:MAG: nicotinate phosphoribosyltransferase, partial [Candidatus Omnitrophica bacterium]|nr:nicotinate phosphoribosyltransferase [Candidatus Omnitrophota bacterium]
SMPPSRNFLVACGLQQALDYVLNLSFSPQDIACLKALPVFKNVGGGFFDYLKTFTFSGHIWAMPEGEIFFARQPVLHVEAPIIEAQILETCLLAIMNIEIMVATKAVRLVQAAVSDGKQRSIIDFGARRAHGPQAGVLAARAAYIGGADGTSNVLAGQKFGIPVYGTMAHSWVEAFDREEEAFGRFHRVFPRDTTLLIDTYDTLRAADMITGLAIRKQIKGVRLDSGNLAALSKRVRKTLDGAGLNSVRIMASGNLNEEKILDLVRQKAPIDAFGVGTELAASPDAPSLDMTYKLVQTKGQEGVRFKAKKSPRKQTLPGQKQVFRITDNKGRISKDVIGLIHESPPPQGRALLHQVVKGGRMVRPLPPIEESRRYLQKCLKQFPEVEGKRPLIPLCCSPALLKLAAL